MIPMEAMELVYLGVRKLCLRAFEPLYRTEISVGVTSQNGLSGGTLISESGPAATESCSVNA